MDNRERTEQKNEKIIGVNRDGSLKTCRFNNVKRGVIDGAGFNENQLISRNVVVESTFLSSRFSYKPAEWKVVQLLNQEDNGDIKGIIYAEEKNVYRVHSKKFPLDFKIAKTKTSPDPKLQLGTMIQFNFPLDGVNLDQYKIGLTEQADISVINKTVVIQDSYHLNYETNLMRLDHSHFVFDVSFSLQIYMRKLELGVVNAYFQLKPHDSEKVMYILNPEQPFMDTNSDGFKREEWQIKTESSDKEKEDWDYSDAAHNFGYLSNNRTGRYGLYIDYNDDDDESGFSGCGDDRGRREAKVVARLEQCKELVEIADMLISALSPDAIGAGLAKEANATIRYLQYLPRDYGSLDNNMRYKELKKEKKRLDELIKQYEEAINEAVIFLVEHDILDQTKTAELVTTCFVADNN